MKKYNLNIYEAIDVGIYLSFSWTHKNLVTNCIYVFSFNDRMVSAH